MKCEHYGCPNESSVYYIRESTVLNIVAINVKLICAICKHHYDEYEFKGRYFSNKYWKHIFISEKKYHKLKLLL